MVLSILQVAMVYLSGVIFGYLVMFSRAIDEVKSAQFCLAVYGSIAVGRLSALLREED